MGGQRGGRLGCEVGSRGDWFTAVKGKKKHRPERGKKKLQSNVSKRGCFFTFICRIC